MLYDNTTVRGSWINVTNMTTTSSTNSRIVNEVTMAMPHSGVVAAASDELNDITQPHDVNVCMDDYLGFFTNYCPSLGFSKYVGRHVCPHYCYLISCSI